MISIYDNSIASRDHDRTITPTTQSTWDYRNLNKQRRTQNQDNHGCR